MAVMQVDSIGRSEARELGVGVVAVGRCVFFAGDLVAVPDLPALLSPTADSEADVDPAAMPAELLAAADPATLPDPFTELQRCEIGSSTSACSRHGPIVHSSGATCFTASIAFMQAPLLQTAVT